MLSTSHTRKAAPVLARGRVRLRLCVRPNAFGNALGGAFVASMSTPSPATQVAGAGSGADYRNGMDIDSDNYAGNRFSAASMAYGVAGNVQASNGYVRNDDYAAGAPRSGMIFSDGGWIDPNGGGGYGGGDSMLLADARGGQLRLSRGSTLDDLDQQIKDAQGVLNMLDNKAARQQAARAAYEKEAAQATSDLYKSGAGDVRGPFYSPSPTGGYGGGSPEFDMPQTISGPSGGNPTGIPNTGITGSGIPGTGTGTPEDPIILPPVIVTAPRMTQAEKDEFDRQNPNSTGVGVLDYLIDKRGTAGYSAVSTWDAYRRVEYKARAVANSGSFMNQFNSLSRSQISQGQSIANQAFEARQALRTATQNTLSPGGKLVSMAIEQKYNFANRYEYYADRAAKAGPYGPMDAYKGIIEGSGSSNKLVSSINSFTKVAGPIGLGLGLASSGYVIANAPVGQTGRVTSEEAGGFLGGLAGGVAATGVVGGLALGAAAIGITVAAPAVLAVGAVAGIAGAVYTSGYGRQAGAYYYNLWGK